MYLQIALVGLLQIIYFTFYYKFGFFVARITKRRVCPVCFSVGSTWLTLIILSITGLFPVSKFVIAMLLSESVVGVSYLTDEYAMLHKVTIPDYIFKFGIIIYGTMSVMTFAFVNEIVGFCLFLPVILFGFYAFTPIAVGKKG